MYTRNYYDRESSTPEGYDGIAMRRDEQEPIFAEESAPVFKEEPQKSEKGGVLEGLFSGLFGKLNIGLPSLDKLGYEELLIIGIAAFLFFSADGDKECALLLLLLLLIN